MLYHIKISKQTVNIRSQLFPLRKLMTNPLPSTLMQRRKSINKKWENNSEEARPYIYKTGYPFDSGTHSQKTNPLHCDYIG